MYSKIRSNYIKTRIKGRGFSQREYIDDLAKLERFILNGVRGFANGMFYHNLKYKYEKEWKAIHEELKPGEFEKIRKWVEKEQVKADKKEREWRAEQKRELEKARTDWLCLDGAA